jgi:hypothetical protein
MGPGIRRDDAESIPKQKGPAFRRDLPALLLSLRSALVTRPLVRVRFLVRTARILLLLARLLATALLLPGLLTRGLILLARIWVLFGHRGLRC